MVANFTTTYLDNLKEAYGKAMHRIVLIALKRDEVLFRIR